MWRSAVQLCAGLRERSSELAHENSFKDYGNGVLKQGGLAQLARAPALQAGGQRFESVILHSVRKDKCSLTY